jgi:hypothetical protein
LEHFPSAIKFIQSGLGAGGSVLVHWSVNIPAAELCHLFLKSY